MPANLIRTSSNPVTINDLINNILKETVVVEG